MQRQQRKKKKSKVFTLMSCTASNINWMINIKFTIFKLVFIFTVVAQVFLMHPKNGKRKTKIYYRKSTNKQINRRMCLYLYVYGEINNNKINEELSIQYFCYFAYNHIINVTVQFCECHRCCERALSSLWQWELNTMAMCIQKAPIWIDSYDWKLHVLCLYCRKYCIDGLWTRRQWNRAKMKWREVYMSLYTQ